MNPKNYPVWRLLVASLLMVFLLGACAASKSETAALEANITKLSAQVTDLQKKIDELAAKLEKDQVAKGSRLTAIEGQLEEIEEDLK